MPTPAPSRIPAIGQVVHYCGKDRQCQVATIIEVCENDDRRDRVTLRVGLGLRKVAEVPFCRVKCPGSWHWKETE